MLGCLDRRQHSNSDGDFDVSGSRPLLLRRDRARATLRFRRPLGAATANRIGLDALHRRDPPDRMDDAGGWLAGALRELPIQALALCARQASI
jgi:hypothetical protein